MLKKYLLGLVRTRVDGMDSPARLLSLAAEQRAFALLCGETPGDRGPDHAMEMRSSKESSRRSSRRVGGAPDGVLCRSRPRGPS